MSEPTLPPRRPLATFLRKAEHDPVVDAASDDVADDAVSDASASTAHPSPGETSLAGEDALQIEEHPTHEDAVAPAAAADVQADADLDAEASSAARAEPAYEHAASPALAARPPGAAVATPGGPSFLRGPGARLHTPRWQWGVAAGLGVLLLLQIAVADRERLAADAGTRPWIAGLCSVLRCTLPAWREPAAFTMISRDVRPVPGQAGALQVQASIRNDARWAQAWPTLQLSLSDADGRVIGTGVFAAQDYLGQPQDPAATLDPGQSGQITFRVREPAASTVAFTFEFL